jgi:hypothetical protein
VNISLKNPFAAKATPPPDDLAETESPLDAAERTVKRWQLEHERTRSKVETLQAEVDVAREDEKHATQTEGVAIYEGQNSTEEAQAAQQAGHRRAALEAAVKIASQKDADAARALEQAERDCVIAEREEIRQRLCTMAGEGEELFIRIKLFRKELVRELAALHELGGSGEQFGYGSNEIRMHFDEFMKLANRHGAAAAADSGAFQKYPSWLHCVEVVCGKRQIEYR